MLLTNLADNTFCNTPVVTIYGSQQVSSVCVIVAHLYQIHCAKDLWAQSLSGQVGESTLRLRSRGRGSTIVGGGHILVWFNPLRVP